MRRLSVSPSTMPAACRFSDVKKTDLVRLATREGKSGVTFSVAYRNISGMGLVIVMVPLSTLADSMSAVWAQAMSRLGEVRYSW